MFMYTLFRLTYNCLGVSCIVHISRRLRLRVRYLCMKVSFLNVSAPEILQRPAPQQGAPLFGAQRPERPSAPANPGQADVDYG